MRTTLPIYDTPELFAEWEKALAVLERIGELGVVRAMGVATRRMIFQVLRAMEAKDVLDIGTCFGTSACTMALAGCSVVTVDIRPINGADGQWRRFGRPRDARTLWTNAGVVDRIEVVRAHSHEYLAETDQTFDFISLDGNHGERHVYDEINLALARLRPQGLIFMDDVQTGTLPAGCTPIHGPKLAIERHLAEGAPFRCIPFTQSMYGDPTGVAFLVGIENGPN